jgi:hypothetical protein
VAFERRSFTPAEEIALTTQVEGCCPLCGTGLFYKKKGRTYRYYKLAYIYTLKPKPAEAKAAQSIALKWRLTCIREPNAAHQFLSSKESRFNNGLDLPELLYDSSIHE